VTTPRRTRLLRVPDLRAFQRTIAVRCCPADVARTRATAVIVSTRAAAAVLRQTLENLLLLEGPAREAIALPEIVTREDWYRRMHERLPAAPPRWSVLEREVMVQAAARDAVRAGFHPPFTLRPGLVAEILSFYDDLRRHRRTVEAFDRLVTGELGPQAAFDRGAARLVAETRFLTATFQAYEERLAASGGIDEHLLRDLVLQSEEPGPFRAVIVTVGDRAADPTGLFAVDFDLLTRIAGLDEIDVVATRAMLASGFHDRLLDRLPGIEVVDAPGDDAVSAPVARSAFVSRDREEELTEVACAIRSAHGAKADPPALERTAVIFRRPLPYVYLAQTVFGAAGVPYQLADALPLAAEPYAAAVDLVFSFVRSGGTRTSTVALLGSPLFVFDVDAARVRREEVCALDRAMAEMGWPGGSEAIAALPATVEGPAGRAARAAAEAARELAASAAPRKASDHLATLDEFLRRHDRRLLPEEPGWERHQRARAAVLSAIDDLRRACLRHDDPEVTFEEVAAVIRRWIEAQTFTPQTGAGGVHLVDAHAARYGDFDRAFVIGLVESDWPGGSMRNIFYPPSVLSQLGWPADDARLAAARAAFIDLLGAARQHVTVSSFTLEDDGLVGPSPFLEEGDQQAADAPARAPVMPRASSSWIELRSSRRPADDKRFHGAAGPYKPDCYKISAVDIYIECPFKFFATFILRLVEEPDEEEGMTPRARGVLVHEVLKAFFTQWQASGRAAVTPANLGDARAMCAEVVNRAVAALPAAEAVIERMRLVGSPVAEGFCDIALRAEAAGDWPVEERLMEHSLEGEFDLVGDRGVRRVALRGRADRIDLLSGGRFRIVDYKLGGAHAWKRMIQLPVYAVAAGQHLAATRGGSWAVAEACYLALGGREHVRPVVSGEHGADVALVAGQQRFLDAIDGMARGEFPPRPADSHLCTYCPFAAVCRKDYVGDE
jgi:RecB family exonuclease